MRFPYGSAVWLGNYVRHLVDWNLKLDQEDASTAPFTSFVAEEASTDVDV